MRLTIAILEDLKEEQKRILQALNLWNKLSKNTFEISTYTKSSDFLSDTHSKQFDIIFLDIQLGNTDPMNGMEIAQKLRKENFRGEFIFLTAFQEYVYQGYEVHAYNYLLKPISYEKLSMTMNALVEDYSDQCYVYMHNRSIIQIPYRDIICFNSTRHTINILTTSATYQHRTSIGKLESNLPGNFARCHRSAIVNMKYILKMTKNNIILSNKLSLQIGRYYQNSFKERFFHYTTRMDANFGGNML